jgi:dihydrofolate reductase
MRRVVLGAYTSIDGYSVDEENGMRDVMMSIDDPEQEEYFVSELSKAGTFIMGRVTYEGMAGFWPTSSHPSAGPMNDIPKVVFSRTLPSADDWPARIARGDTAEEIAKLKPEPGGDIVVSGGIRFQRSLIRLGLVDEYRLWVLPAAAGRDEALFAGLDHPLGLRLVKSTAFSSSGVLELVYSPAGHQDLQAGQPGANP